MDTLLRICDLYNVNLDLLLRGDIEKAKMADTAKYDAFMNRHALYMAVSFSLLVFGMALLNFLSTIGVPDLISAAALALIFTVSVVILTATSIQYDHFRKRHPILQDFYTDDEKNTFYQKYIWYISGMVGMLFLDMALIVLTLFVLPDGRFYVPHVTTVFLLLLTGVVFFGAYAGQLEQKYKINEYNRINDPTPEAKKRLNLIRTLCTCTMLTVTGIVLFLGITRNAWDTTMWILIGGGILCAVISVALNPYKRKD